MSWHDALSKARHHIMLYMYVGKYLLWVIILMLITIFVVVVVVVVVILFIVVIIIMIIMVSGGCSESLMNTGKDF